MPHQHVAFVNGVIKWNLTTEARGDGRATALGADRQSPRDGSHPAKHLTHDLDTYCLGADRQSPREGSHPAKHLTHDLTTYLPAFTREIPMKFQ